MIPAVRPEEADEVTETEVEDLGVVKMECTSRSLSAGVIGSDEKSLGVLGDGFVDLTPCNQSESL